MLQGKDYEITSFVTLELGVKNQEPLWVCKEKASGGMDKGFYDSAVIMIKVKDANDPPVFSQNPVILHQIEEEKPGKVLFTPKVTDVDSDASKIKWVLAFCLYQTYRIIHLLDFLLITMKYYAIQSV